MCVLVSTCPEILLWQWELLDFSTSMHSTSRSHICSVDSSLSLIDCPRVSRCSACREFLRTNALAPKPSKYSVSWLPQNARRHMPVMPRYEQLTTDPGLEAERLRNLFAISGQSSSLTETGLFDSVPIKSPYSSRSFETCRSLSNLTSPHLTSPHLTSPHLISSHLVSSRLVSFLSVIGERKRVREHLPCTRER
eukprot:768486-Hanusia_phi.AAC.8